jgi:hypothetical protein
VQSSVWNPTSLKSFHVRPPSRLMWLPAVSPDSPTLINVLRAPDTQAASSAST